MASAGTAPPPEEIGDRIRRLRKSRGWGQAELATKVGVGRLSVTNWETNKFTPSSENLMEMARHFGVSPMYIMHGEGGLYRKAVQEIGGIIDWIRSTETAGAAPSNPPVSNVEELESLVVETMKEVRKESGGASPEKKQA